MAICHASQAGYRFLVLIFNCLLTFGSYFCFDMPSVLQLRFQTQPCNESNVTTNSSSNTSCCTDCLGLTSTQYNLLYSVYAWTNALVVIGAGFLIDKLGNRVGVFLFSSLCVVGSCLFALGTVVRSTPYMLPLMLLGRIIFGGGNGSLTIVQNRINTLWFYGKELALGFGITLSFSRLGSVMNFFFTEHFTERFGLQWTLWGGAFLCGIGFLSAIIVSFLDIMGMRQLAKNVNIALESKKLRFTDIRHFSLAYWLLAFIIMFFYNGVFPFVANANTFIVYKYRYEKDTASYVTGAVYDVSMVVSPFLGGIIDVIGKRGILAASCGILTIPVFGLLAFTHVPPLISTIWLGITYSVAAASMWPSIPLVVNKAHIGTAMGLTTSLQMIGIGISNLIVGKILDNDFAKSEPEMGWRYVMIYLLINTVACVATSIVLNIIDKRKDGILNISRKHKNEQLQQQQSCISSEVSGTYNESEQSPDGDIVSPTEKDPLLPKGPINS